MDHIENTTSKSSSVVVCVFVPAGTCLPSHCIAVAVSSGYAILPFRCHVTVYFHFGIASQVRCKALGMKAILETLK
jgi:hypothetical protein